jgi:epoxyqueuosine reductase QueG
MKSTESITLEKDPGGFIEKVLSAFVEDSPSNRRKADEGKYFNAPLVGYASGDDPQFMRYKRIIGKFHLTPQEVFNLTFGEGAGEGPLTVIAWVLPISEDTRRSNRRTQQYPSLLWSHTRYFGEMFNAALRDHVVSMLTAKGYRAVAPSNSSYFTPFKRAPKAGLTSNWSERHVAYACGLGTFGLCDGFITPKGKAVRVGTVVTDLIVSPSDKPYADHHANCLYYVNGTCRACATRCPAGAVTESGHDKDKCRDYQDNVVFPIKNPAYGVKISGCGLCQTGVPCEFEIPRQIRETRARNER